MEAVIFRRSSSRPDLYLADCGDSAASGSFQARAGLLLSDRPVESPDEIDLSTAWRNYPHACFFFLPVALQEDEVPEFAAAAEVYLQDRTRSGARLAWFDNPNEARSGLRGHFIASYEAGGQHLTDRTSYFDFRNLSIWVGKDCPISQSPDGEGFRIEQPEKGRLAILTPSGRLNIIDGHLTVPLCGPNAGALRFALTLGKNHGISDLAHLDIGLRFYYPDPVYQGTSERHFLGSQHYPLFMDRALPLTLYANLDRFALLDGQRTFLSFFDPHDSAGPGALPSGFRTNLGYTIHLTPLGEDSRLIFARKPTESSGEGRSTLMLVPTGDFAITVPRYSPTASQDPSDYDDNLLCGLSGVEYIKLAPARMNILSFAPGGAAYAPEFRSGIERPSGRADSALTDLATTPWAYVRQEGESPPIYYTQPDRAVLHHAGDQSANGEGGDDESGSLLHYLEIPVSELPPSSDSRPLAFPLAPYGAVSTKAIVECRQLEHQVISEVRRTNIQSIAELAVKGAPLGPPEAAGQTITATTLQGLLATFSGDFEVLQELVLARDTEGALLQLTGVKRRSPLRAALQSNQLFLVITDPQSIEAHFSGNQLTIQDWTFDLAPRKWQASGTILLFKYAEQPLMDLVKNVSAWSMPNLFIGPEGPKTVQQKLIALLQEALQKAPPTEETGVEVDQKDRENYQILADAARNKNWTGVIALNVSVPPSNLPPELQGLAAGIDESRFIAKFVGVATTPVHVSDGGQLSAGQSSLFGLIDYQDDRLPPPNDSGYNFRVKNLSVLFQNSQVKDFSSEIKVTLDKLFGEDIRLVSTGDVALEGASVRNDILLKGRYESHDGHRAYVFSFSGSNRFALLESAAIHDVEIVKAQFITNPPQDPEGFQPGEVVIGRFLFWGWLNFKKLEAFDIFSFGADEPGTADGGAAVGRYLRFSNLTLRMTFRWLAAEGPQFDFDPAGITFDPTKSQARNQSLYARFPLKLAGMASSAEGQLPDDMGYLPVSTPLGGRKPKDTWFGLTYDLELGSAGALAERAGLVVGLLAAWRPGGDENVYVGLQLPGSSGGNREFNIQGVIKIVFKHILFLVDEDPKTAERSYVLKLKNIMLKFLHLSFPPNAQTEIIIFGDPQMTAGQKTLGWYAAYAKSGGRKPPKKLPKDIFS